jgi:hypothetical protein
VTEGKESKMKETWMSNRLESARLGRVVVMCLLESITRGLGEPEAEKVKVRIATLGRQLGVTDHLMVREQLESFDHAFVEALVGAFELVPDLRRHIMGLASTWDWFRFLTAARLAHVDLGLEPPPIQQLLEHTEVTSVMLLDPETQQRVECHLGDKVELLDGYEGQPNRQGTLAKVLRPLPQPGEFLVQIMVDDALVPTPTMILRLLSSQSEPASITEVLRAQEPEVVIAHAVSQPPLAVPPTVPEPASQVPEISEKLDEWWDMETPPPAPPAEEPPDDEPEVGSYRIVTLPLIMAQELFTNEAIRLRQHRTIDGHSQGDPVLVAGGSSSHCKVLGLATLIVNDGHWQLKALAELNDEKDTQFQGQGVLADPELCLRANRAAVRAVARGSGAE